MVLRFIHALFTLLISAIVCNSLFAQTQNPRYNFKHLNVQNGLAQDIVYHFLQDSRGYMWMGTRNGLSFYDGSRTISFLHNEQDKKSISGNFITRILEDSQHQVWVGTGVGISRYNRIDNSFSNFSILPGNSRLGVAFCVPMGIVNGHELWVIETQTKSIRAFDTRTHRSSLLINTTAVDGIIRHDRLSNTTHIWTYLSTGTIHYIFKGHSMVKEESFFSSQNIKNEEPLLQVVHVLAQNDSLAWLSTTKGLIELNPQNRKYKLYTKSGNQLINEIRYTALAPNGMLWVATGNTGVYTFELKTKKFIDNFRSFRVDPFSICSNNIVSIYFDRFGNVWCGSYGQGISYTNVDKNLFQKNLSRNEMDNWEGNNNVFWIGYDNSNNLWCIINDAAGLWKLNAEKRILEHRQPIMENGQPFIGRFYKMLFEGKRFAWCVGKDGLFQYDLASNRLVKMRYKAFSTGLFGSNWVQDIIRLNDQSLLFSTFGGLYSITPGNPGYRINLVSELNKPGQNSFAFLFQDEKGMVYVKDVGSNLHVLKKLKGQNTYSILKSLNFLPEVNQFYADTLNNYILIATNNGLFQLKRNDYSLKKVNELMNIPFLSVRNLLKTDNRLWLFGEKGLYCYNEKTKRGRIFTVEDGLPANEFNTVANPFSATGEYIAGTTNGLVSFFPNKVSGTIYPPMAQLTNIYINDALTEFVANPQEINTISLSHRQNTFSFDFAAIAFQHEGESTFEYRLEGYDADWIKSGTIRHTRYSRIPPGKYVFHLRVIDANGSVSPYKKVLQIDISKAWWQTNLAIIVTGVMVLVLVWLVLKWYLNGKIRKHKREFEKQQAVEKERTRIATDMHDDFGGGLSRIKFLSQSIQLKTNDHKNITDDVSKIAQYSDEMVDKMGEIVWALNEKNDSLADLLAFTRAYAVEYLCSHSIECHFKMPDEVPEFFISGEIRRNIFLSVKEALHNVIKHASATEVIIQIAFHKKLKITINDNGKGIDFNHLRRFGNGLTNIHERIKSIGGKATIKNNNGALIQMEVPL